MTTKQHKPHKVNSFQAKSVALDVIKKVSQGKPVNLREIQIKNGYSLSSAKAMKATKARSYIDTLNPAINKMIALRDKTINALQSKDLDNEKLFDLNNLLKNLNHDLQLLNGKSTDNHSHLTNVVIYGSDDFLALQMKKNKDLTNS